MDGFKAHGKIQRLKGLSLFHGRVRDFLNDGYVVLFLHHLGTFSIARLRHRNGNVVTLKIDNVSGILSQYTNGKLAFSQKVC